MIAIEALRFLNRNETAFWLFFAPFGIGSVVNFFGHLFDLHPRTMVLAAAICMIVPAVLLWHFMDLVALPGLKEMHRAREANR